MQQTIELPRHARSAEMRPQSFDATNNTIEAIWTTGADVLRSDWIDGSYIERLSTDAENVRLGRLNNGAAFLDTHNAFELSGVLGSVVPGTARMEDGLGKATIQLSRAAGVQDIVQNIRDGVIRNISVGYIVHAYSRTEAEGGAPAVMQATDWEPVELSAVPVPADPGAQIRAAARGASGVEVYPCRVTRANSPQTEASMADNTDKPQAGKTGETGANKPVDGNVTVQDPAPQPGPQPNNPNVNEGMVQAEINKPKDKVLDPGDAHPLPLNPEQERQVKEGVKRALAEDRDRVKAITEIATQFGMRSFGDEHTTAGTSVQDFRNKVLDKLADERSKHGGPTVTSAAEPSLEARAQSRDPRAQRAAGEAWARQALGKTSQNNGAAR